MANLALAPALDVQTLLREQHHRINNEFTSAINLVAAHEAVRRGEIKVKLMRLGSWVNCRVTDNGSGLKRIKLGRGLRIVGDLARSLGGRIRHIFGATWTSFELEFPLTQREQRTNRAIARRPGTGRRLKTVPPLRSLAGERAKAVGVQPSP